MDKTKFLFPDVNECRTTSDGAQQYVPCIFPFRHGRNGILYHGCTTFGNKEGDERSWCSTKVDSRGIHINNQGFWGICADDCPKDLEGTKDIGFKISK